MNAYNLSISEKERRIGPYLMDTNSDRYRECLNCGFVFMARHRSTIYCCDSCADEYYNTHKRSSSKTQEKIQLTEHAMKGSFEKNLMLLNQLALKIGKEMYVDYSWMLHIGFDFACFSERNKLYNIDPALNCHYLQIECYRIYRVEHSLLLIYKTH